MARPAKDGKFMNFKIDLEIAEALEKYSEESMIPKTRIVEKALKEYLALACKNTPPSRKE